MKKWDRVLLVVLILAYIAGTPGLGIDTRADAPGYLAIVYGIAFLTPLLALGASFKWTRAAGSLGVLAGLLAVMLPALDLAGLTAGAPPAAMVVLDVVTIALGLAVMWRAWPVARLQTA